MGEHSAALPKLLASSTTAAKRSPQMTCKPSVLLLVGYFDWFSGYQETALATALARRADVEVVASDRVSPIFSDQHLTALGVNRQYPLGTTYEHGVQVTRFHAAEVRSMVWANAAVRYLRKRRYDLVVQVMPGQGLPIIGSFMRKAGCRAVLYGDNKAMWTQLSPPQRVLKGAAFAISKGLAYAFVNSRADRVYGYTENTLSRLKVFGAGKTMDLMPLVFDPAKFHYSQALREQARRKLGYGGDDVVIVAAGKIEPRKRLDWLVDAFPGVVEAANRAHLLLVGGDNSAYCSAIETRAEEVGFHDRIRVLPFVDFEHLNAIFNAADIGIWPKQPAITIQQAMATGLPVVLPHNDLVGHLVKPGSGLYYTLVEGGEPAIVEDALRRALARWGSNQSGRSKRAYTNSWLSAAVVVEELLAQTNGIKSERKAGSWRRRQQLWRGDA